MLLHNQFVNMLAYWDRSLICRFANQAYRDWFGGACDNLLNVVNKIQFPGLSNKAGRLYVRELLTGKQQVFERSLTFSEEDTRKCLVTFIPDLDKGYTRGFFMIITDHGFKFDAEEMRNVIEEQENERRAIAIKIRDDISQTLAYCRMLALQHPDVHHGDRINTDLVGSLGKAISDLRSLTADLIPAAIEDFGFCNGTKDYINSFKSLGPSNIMFDCDSSIEEIELNDKLSLFRIIQNLLLLFGSSPHPPAIQINIEYHMPLVKIFADVAAANLVRLKESKEFREIQQRVAYYRGRISEQILGKRKKYLILLQMPPGANQDNAIRS